MSFVQNVRVNKRGKLLIFVLMITLVIAGCSNASNNNATSNADPASKDPGTATVNTPQEVPYIEVWGNHGNFKNAIEKDSPYSQWMVEKVGVGYTSPLVPWEGEPPTYKD